MARTAVTITDTVANTGISYPAGTSADAANDHVVSPSFPIEELLLIVTHTASSEKDLTVKAGGNPPADAAGQGDLEIAFAAGNDVPVTKIIGPFSSARFIQKDGSLNVDLESGFTGALRAVRLSRSA